MSEQSLDINLSGPAGIVRQPADSACRREFNVLENAWPHVNVDLLVLRQPAATLHLFGSRRCRAATSGSWIYLNLLWPSAKAEFPTAVKGQKSSDGKIIVNKTAY